VGFAIGWHARAVPCVIRAALPEDGPALQAIERLAGERYRDVGLAVIADDAPPSVNRLSSYATAGRSWVAVDASGCPVGYVLADRVDGNAHVEQVSVTPAAQGLGIGRALICRVERWALESDMRALTLTTFAAVPWNGPLYEHLGFRVLTGDEVGPELRTIRGGEAAHGLDVARRVCMRVDLTDGATTPVP
jgi:GNAT superfamily N-acetyltransferase